ncbi:hypothetical protein TNCV_2540731 [Trichonephila clavipes]|nr:hypothetical protein TNCV_2540731 [Trichonephila clavipes]
MRLTKDQLVEKDVLMPVKHNVFLWNLPDVEEILPLVSMEIPLRTARTVRMAVVTCSQNQAVFARRRIKVKAELKLKKGETLEKKLGTLEQKKREAAKENARGARAGVTF